MLIRGQNPKKWTDKWEKLLSSHLCISVNNRGTMENSSDLSLGRRPMSKSEEFSIVPRLFTEISWFHTTFRLKKSASLFRILTPRLNISITNGLYRKHSSDLSFRRRLMSKPDEFFSYNPLVIEISSLLCEIARRLWCTYSLIDPSTDWTPQRLD